MRIIQIANNPGGWQRGKYEGMTTTLNGVPAIINAINDQNCRVVAENGASLILRWTQLVMRFSEHDGLADEALYFKGKPRDIETIKRFIKEEESKPHIDGATVQMLRRMLYFKARRLDNDDFGLGRNDKPYRSTKPGDRSVGMGIFNAD